MSENPISSETLFELRLAWLKSISKIWYAESSLDAGESEEAKFAQKLVKKNYIEYVKEGYPNGAMSVLTQEEMLDNPWDIELHVKHMPGKAPLWNPGTGEYDVSNPKEIEQVLIYIPPKPAKHQTEAAADFYAHSPSIFGGFDSQMKRENDQSPGTIAALMKSLIGTKASLSDSEDKSNLEELNPDTEQPSYAPPASQPTHSTARFDVATNTDPLYAFGAVLFDAVCLAWSNETYMKKLTTQNPIDENTGNLVVEQIGKAERELLSSFGFTFPWNFDLVIAIDEDATYSPESGWKTTKKNRLVLVVPEAPTDITDYGPMALSSYNAGGYKYPFSCG